ncbi:hypothetical protein BC831DRAFT_92148 [Entophlyctis helioformis]|nr:hypothetical protein BC831DRAFT_92148 [Entophlyctis helioformis]
MRSLSSAGTRRSRNTAGGSAWRRCSSCRRRSRHRRLRCGPTTSTTCMTLSWHFAVTGRPQNASPSMMAHQPAGWSIDTSPQPPATPPQAQCSPPGPYMASLINHDAYTANGSPLLISHMQGMQLCAGAMPASASLMTSYQIEQLLASDS